MKQIKIENTAGSGTGKSKGRCEYNQNTSYACVEMAQQTLFYNFKIHSKEK
jgi:hypothetical protein